MRRVRLVATGRVQGVFFRDSVRREAGRLGLAGWALNRDDGAVEGVIQGDEGAVGKMIDFWRAGPGSSSVEDVEITDEEAEGDVEDLGEFEIR